MRKLIVLIIVVGLMLGVISWADGEEKFKGSVNFSPNINQDKAVELVPATKINHKKPLENYEPLGIKTNTSHEAERNIKIIDKYLKNRLKGKGNVYVTQGIMHNVDPFLLVAISMHETAHGSSDVLRDYNNVAGLMHYGKTWRNYKTIDDSIAWFARLLADYYINRGQNDLISIGEKFCPEGAGNDPKGLNKHWIPNVKKFYLQFVEEIKRYEEQRIKDAEISFNKYKNMEVNDAS